MATWLLQLSYTSGAWAARIRNPQDRSEAVRASIETLGGSIKSFWMAFGEHDVVGFIEMSDNVSAAAFAIAILGGGSCHNVKTTPLLTLEEGIGAMKKAITAGQ